MVIYTRKFILVVCDFILINLAVYFSLLLRFDGSIPTRYIGIFLKTFLIVSVLKILIYYLFGLYKSLWRNASIEELIKLMAAVSTGALASFMFGQALSLSLPRSAYIISWLLTFMFLGSHRLSYRILRRIRNMSMRNSGTFKRVMVIGGGDAGSMLIKELKNHENLKYKPVAVIDDDNWKHRSNIHSVPIVGGREKIKEIAEEEKIDEIIVAIPSAERSVISEILAICKETKCRLKTLPGIYEIIGGRVGMEQIRDVGIEDLLGREEVKLNTQEVAGYLEGEIVLVTGGGGSIGSELCRQIARLKPKKLLVFDVYENSAYDLQNELLHKYKDQLNIRIIIGSVRDKKRLMEVFREYRPGVVFHAAAHKHVPLMEADPGEAIKNNIFGTFNTAQCADEFGVKKFVLISTDKAVNPTNVMGATKRAAEMIIQSMARSSKTEFVAVRFGNVLGSNGSVIPIFKKQIASGGPVTVTHPEITRFFMTIPEAAQLVIQAGAMAKGGEIFILDMGKPVKIVDLAKDLIRLSGFEPDRDIKIEFTGLRPGEKLYEELMLAEEGIESTRHEKIFVGKPMDINIEEIKPFLIDIENSLADGELVKKCLAELVPTYACAEREVAAAAELG